MPTRRAARPPVRRSAGRCWTSAVTVPETESRPLAHPPLVEQMDAHGIDVVVLCGENNVTYATGHVAPSHEPARGGATRVVAIITKADEQLGRAPLLDFDKGARALASAVADYPGTVAIDQYPSLAVRAALADRSPASAGPLLAAAKFVKTREEIDRIRQAQRINEQAMDDVLAALRPGMHDTDL